MDIDWTVATLCVVLGSFALELEAEVSPQEEGSLIGVIVGGGLDSGGR